MTAHDPLAFITNEQAELCNVDSIRGDNVYVHESAYVDAPSRIGSHSSVMHFSHIMAHSIIGEHSHIGHHVTVAGGVIIGNSVKVMNNSLLNSGVILQDNVYCGASTVFNPLNRMRGHHKIISKISPTLVKQGTSIGANSSIASGVTIGQNVFIETGTVVDASIPDFALMLGNPMKLIGWRCECGENLIFKQDDIECAACGKLYHRESSQKIWQKHHPDEQVNEKISG